MSGGFFRGTSADQDTRFSNKQAKLMKSQKFAPELEHLVDGSKVKMDVMRPWIANRVTELIGFEDEVLINFIYGLLDGKEINGKEVQISLTGFMERNTGKFMKELWSLLLSAQKNVSGVPQQFLDAKEEETKKKKAESDRIASEIQKRRDKESQELEQERKEKMDRGYSLKDADRGVEPSNRHERRSAARPVEDIEIRDKNGSRGRSRSRSLSSSDKRERSSSSERLHRNSPRQSLSPHRRRSPRRHLSPSRRSLYSSRRKSTSRSDRRSPSPHHYRIRCKSRSPLRRRSRSPVWRRPRSPTRRSSPIRRRSPSAQRKSPSPIQGESPPPSKLRSPSLVRPKYRRSPSTRNRSRSPIRRRSRTPIRRRSRTPIQRRSRTPIRRRSRTPIRRKSRTPIRRRSRTPIRQRSQSPIRRRSRSPIRRRSRSPIRRRSRSPVRRRSPSSRHQRVWSPIRRRSPSPIGRRSLSPIRHMSNSPVRGESNSPSGSRSPKKSPKVANRKSPSQERSSASPVQSRSPSPAGGRSPLQAPRGRSSRGYEKQSPVHGSVARKAVEQPKEARQQFNLRKPPSDSLRNLKRSSPSLNRSPSLSEPERERHVIEKRDSTKFKHNSSAKPSSSDQHNRPHSEGHDHVPLKRGNQSEKLEHHKIPDEQEPQKVRNFLPSDKRKESPSKVRNSAGEKIESHSGDTRINKQHLEPLQKLPRKDIEDGRSPSLGSDSEDSDRDTAKVPDKQKNKRPGKRDLESDDGSSYDSYAERKEAKRRKKEEKKLKKEDKRRRREERRRRKEEKRSGKHKLKSGGTVSTPSDTDGKHDDDFDVDQDVKRHKSGQDNLKEPLTEQKKLEEIKLREKALESYRAKKGISH